MSLASLFHTDVVHEAKTPLDLRAWFEKAGRTASLEKHSLLSVAVVTGYLLVIASLTLALISGGFPWFVLMLIVFAPLYALMAVDGNFY
jgi:hypothetical protein